MHQVVAKATVFLNSSLKFYLTPSLPSNIIEGVCDFYSSWMNSTTFL